MTALGDGCSIGRRQKILCVPCRRRLVVEVSSYRREGREVGEEEEEEPWVSQIEIGEVPNAEQCVDR